MSRPRRMCGNILRLVSFLIHWRLGRLRSSHKISRSRSADTHWSSSERGEVAGVFGVGIIVTALAQSGFREVAGLALDAGDSACPVLLFLRVTLTADRRGRFIVVFRRFESLW